MGPNGSGKSTLSHVLMGREGYEATSGSVTVDGTEILGLETWRRAAAGLPGGAVGQLHVYAIRQAASGKMGTFSESHVARALRPLRLLWPARCWKALTCQGLVACWC